MLAVLLAQKEGAQWAAQTQQIVDLGLLEPVVAHLAPRHLADVQLDLLIGTRSVGDGIAAAQALSANHVNVLARQEVQQAAGRQTQHHAQHIARQAFDFVDAARQCLGFWQLNITKVVDFKLDRPAGLSHACQHEAFGALSDTQAQFVLRSHSFTRQHSPLAGAAPSRSAAVIQHNVLTQRSIQKMLVACSREGFTAADGDRVHEWRNGLKVGGAGTKANSRLELAGTHSATSARSRAMAVCKCSNSSSLRARKRRVNRIFSSAPAGVSRYA